MRLKISFLSILLIGLTTTIHFTEEKPSADNISSAQQRLEVLRKKVAETLLQPIKPSRVIKNSQEARYPTGGSEGATLSVSMSPRLSVPMRLEKYTKYGRKMSYRHKCRLCRIYKKCPRTLKNQ